MAVAPLLLLLLCVGGVFSSNGWKSKHEYSYNIEGRTLASLPTTTEHLSGIHYRGTLIVQSNAADTLYLKLENITYGTIHSEIKEGWWEGPLPENFQELNITDSTFGVKLNNGLISTLFFKHDLEDWEINFIQGVIGHLQSDQNDKRRSVASFKNNMHDRDTKQKSVFSVMEDSVTGTCEVIYEVTKLPKLAVLAFPDWMPHAEICDNHPFLEITKTRNYSNCEDLTEFHFAFPESLNCEKGGSQCEHFWTRASVTRMTGCGDSKEFLPLSSVSSSRVLANLHLHNGTEASVNTYLNISIVSVEQISEDLPVPSKVKLIERLGYYYTPKVSSEKSSSHNHQGSNADVSEEHQEMNIQRRTRSSNSQNYKDSKSKPHTKKSHDRNEKKNINEKASQHTATPKHSKFHSPSEENSSLLNIPPLDFFYPPHYMLNPVFLTYKGSNALIPNFKDLITEIASDFGNPIVIPEKRPLEKLNLAVKLCRVMNYDELVESTGIFMRNQEQESNMQDSKRKIVRDVIAMCGTNPAFKLLKSWIESKKLKGEVAADLISSLPLYLQTPSSNLVEMFYDLVRSEVVRNHRQMKVSSVLAFSNLLRIACFKKSAIEARYTKQMMPNACTPTEGIRYVAWFKSQLKADAELRHIYLIALGNSASPIAVPFIRSVIEDSSNSPLIRAVAVLALRHQVLANPQDHSQMLMNLYNNLANPLNVRIASLSLLIYAKPGLSFWQKIAISTWYEPSPAMKAFVWSTLKSLSRNNDPVLKDMASAAASVLFLARPTDLGFHLPYNWIWSRITQELQHVLSQQFFYSPNPDAANIYYRYTERLGGLSQVLFQGDLLIANPDEFFVTLKEYIIPRDNTTIVRPPILNLPHSTHWIRETLKIAPRVLEKLEGLVHTNYDNLEERILSFNKSSLADVSKVWKKLIEEMKQGKDYHYQKTGQNELSLSIPNEMGFPISMELKTVWATKSIVRARINAEASEINLEISAMCTSQFMGGLTVFPGWDKSIYVAETQGMSLQQIPHTRMHGRLNKEQLQVQFTAQVLVPEDELVIYQHESKTYMSLHNVQTIVPLGLSKGTVNIQPDIGNKPETVDLPHVLVTYYSDGRPYSLKSWLRDSIPVRGFPMMWHSLAPAAVEVQLKNLSPLAVNISLGLAEVINNEETFIFIPKEDENGILSVKPIPSPQKLEEDIEHKMHTTPEPTSSSGIPLTESNTPTISSTTLESTSNGLTSTSSTTAAGADSTNTEKTVVETEEILPSDKVIISKYNGSYFFNSSTLVPWSDEINGTAVAYLLRETLTGIDSGNSFVINMNATIFNSMHQNYILYLSYAQDLVATKKRVGIFLQSEYNKSKARFTCNSDTPPLPLVHVQEILSSNMSSAIYGDLYYQENNSLYTVSYKGSSYRNAKATNALKQSRDGVRCLSDHQPGKDMRLACRNVAYKASKVNSYNFTFSSNGQIKELPNGPTHFRVDEENNRAHLVYYKSNNETKIDFNMNPLLTAALTYSPVSYDHKNIYSPAFCSYSNNLFTTFAGVELNQRLGECWHVLAKDCSGKGRIVVLAREVNSTTNIEVNVDNYKVLSASSTDFVTINGKVIELDVGDWAEVRDLVNTTLLQVTVAPDQSLNILAPAHGLSVFYTSEGVILRSGSSNRKRLCGICGNYDMEKLGDLTNPQGNVEKTAEAFIESYRLEENNCIKRHSS